ncbi:hypothetical protein K7W42_04440 [Deinococcus sp. HMF7604]|uniref:hypothetical protein n=1 Tax=Deinococcus betulae TaxID=2873312 RepID=UPI001CCBA4E0|nr:hypothetical protein [Deinococcus betulae]MBZ9750108.1 hypothetical protein [Deinococcus betulae]
MKAVHHGRRDRAVIALATPMTAGACAVCARHCLRYGARVPTLHLTAILKPFGTETP